MEEAKKESKNGLVQRGLSLDEMFERYPRHEVEKAMYRIDYPSRRVEVIRQFEKQIDQGVNVESCREGIQWALKNMPLSRPVDPTESQDLHPDVLWRIQSLKYMYRDPFDIAEEELVNYHAVLDAYRNGRLHVDLEKVTVWFAGEMKLGPFPRSDLKKKATTAQVSAWRADGHGRVWIEDVINTDPAKLSTISLPPSIGDSDESPRRRLHPPPSLRRHVNAASPPCMGSISRPREFVEANLVQWSVSTSLIGLRPVTGLAGAFRASQALPHRAIAAHFDAMNFTFDLPHD
ncbi:uncharacterized protein N7459_000095 [Penicillium hispanicum]|uniref:uncharacterized protein n=1 Tax=Penicillium hispanicum TaxID=1080232 RepID=UPI0025420D14|nr:uncharacterized protein N7459_000095 [Penicillium hispanicum]KAJ5593887.1 hypothetical protein N7459_000095 [Penicillium hispanicum]